MYPENKLLSAVLGVIIFLMLIAIIFMNYVINNNKKAITFFKVEEFSNISYSNKDNCKFEIKKDKIYLTINNETILDGDSFELDSTSGEIKTSKLDKDLYVRSVGRTNITLWYKYKVYVFDKDTIAN
jgi:hypothetical protein